MALKPLLDDPLFAEATGKMHELWSWTIDRPGYREAGIKKKWQELEAIIERLARRGLL